jgi:hypothetical protein
MVDSLGLEIGRTYSPEQLSALFGFKPYYLRTTGGMVSVPTKGALLLVTHAEQAASFEYDDCWEGDRLVYTGRGQDGDQTLEGSNRDVAENRRILCVFEHVGKYERRFLGRATCAKYWWAVAPDRKGKERRVLRFYLRLDGPPSTAALVRSSEKVSNGAARLPARRPRPFEERAPMPRTPARPSQLTPAERSQLVEKINGAHHALLVALKRRLETDGWSELEEIPVAVDLWARRRGVRVIFEAKTITSDNELEQTRSALSQLLEYRFFYGTPDDGLCVVTDAPISDRRLRFLEAMNVHVLCFDGEIFRACGPRRSIVESKGAGSA